MQFKTLSGAAGMLVLLASAGLAPAAATTPGALVAQSSESTQTQANDALMTKCSRYRAAYKRLDAVRAELSELRPNFAPTDDITPKLEALVTQTNDAMTTAKARVDSCPVKLR